MDPAGRSCATCAATNRADAQWCARCLTAFSPAPHVAAGVAPATARPGPRSPAAAPDFRRWIKVGLVVVVLLVGMGIVTTLRDIGRFSVAALEARPDPRGFRFNNLDPGTGDPVRFDPCTPLHYVVNASLGPPGALRDVRAAVRKTAEATGIHFVYDGRTHEGPIADRPPFDLERYGDRWSPILIAWAPDDPSLFQGDVVGTARSPYVANADGRLVYVGGTVYLKASAQLDDGFGAGRTWGKVVLHELGHIVGLDHVDNPSEVMNPALVSSPASWGPGDGAGLRELGRLAGCLDVPELP